MTKEEVLAQLEGMGDENTKRIWMRFGLQTKDTYYGVKVTKLREFAKKIKKDHALSLALWQTGVHDAKLLATMIEDPKKVTEAQIDEQLSMIYSMDVMNSFCSHVVGLTPWQETKMANWVHSENHHIRRGGYTLLNALAKDDDSKSNDYFIPYLALIEANMATEENWVKEMMNYALINIGSRNKALHAMALGAAQKIGKIVIDYGESSCKYPQPTEALQAEKLLAKLV